MWIRPINEFDHSRVGIIAATLTKLDDTCVSTVALENERCNRIEQLLQDGLVLDEATNHTTVVHVNTRNSTRLLRAMSVTSTRDQLLCKRTKFLRLCNRCNNALMFEK